MTVGALEVGRSSFSLRVDIPTSAAFVGDKGEIQRVCYLLDESGILEDRLKSVSD